MESAKEMNHMEQTHLTHDPSVTFHLKIKRGEIESAPGNPGAKFFLSFIAAKPSSRANVDTVPRVMVLLRMEVITYTRACFLLFVIQISRRNKTYLYFKTLVP